MSWLVHRICVFCGRKFSFQQTPGEELRSVCPECWQKFSDACDAAALGAALAEPRHPFELPD